MTAPAPPLSIEVAVATMEERNPLQRVERLGLADSGALVTLVNQVRSAPPPRFVHGEVRMVSYAETGLSRSRNRALELAQGDVLLLADDDIRYQPGLVDLVRRAFADAPEAAAITFQMLQGDGGPSKHYPPHPFKHNALSVPRVSSVEVALRPAKLAGLRFDERFGLGATFGNGEEAIFLADALRRGLSIRYAPYPICTHAGPTSGQRSWDSNMLLAKGAVLRRLYPAAWPVALGAFGLLKLGQRPTGMALVTWWTGLLSGARAVGRESTRKR